MEKIRIAIDAMGGDHGPAVTVPAAQSSLQRHKNLDLILVGDLKTLQQTLERHPNPVNDRITLQHASETVAMDEPPSQALRSKKDSSMRVAINQVKAGTASACVSAGNTGALMAIARFVLKTQEGIDRPAIIARLPTMKPSRVVHMLDLGANVDSTADHLFQFAVMGSVLTSAVENIPKPAVGLLNIGVEQIKGNDLVKEVAKRLTESNIINYIGYVEADQIFSGDVDVVVCDGFVGNVSLKTLEGGSKLFSHYMKVSFNQNILTKLVGLAVKPVLKKMKNTLDPGRNNGASLIGLHGIVIKSHGGAGVFAFHRAIEQAIAEVEKNVPQRTKDLIAKLLSQESVI